MSKLMNHAVIELIQLVERITSVVQFGDWYTEHGDRVELGNSDKRALESLRGDLNDMQSKLAEALTDEQRSGE